MKRYLLHSFYHNKHGDRVTFKGAFDDFNEAKEEAFNIQRQYWEIAERFDLPIDKHFSPIWIDDTKKAILYELDPDAHIFGEVEIPSYARYWEKK